MSKMSYMLSHIPSFIWFGFFGVIFLRNDAMIDHMIDHGVQNDIQLGLLVSPQNTMPLMKTVSNVFTDERRRKNFDCISLDSPIIDCAMSREQALAHSSKFPKEIVSSQELITVRYFSYDNTLHQGQLVVHKLLANDILEIFRELEVLRYPIEKCIPITSYNWDDDASMADNNTSAFNYRTVPGKKRISDHAYGRAIDINPCTNPWVGGKGVPGCVYNTQAKGTIIKGDALWRAFIKRGWKWGGSWKNSKDYQHFSKR